MKTIKHTTMTEAPSILISMSVEQMLFRTEKDGFYEYALSEMQEEGTIEGLQELLEIEVEPESANDFEFQFRVFAIEYKVGDEEPDDENHCQ